MILVDARVGSGELLKDLKGQGVDAQLSDLPFGDFEFLGNGPGGGPVFVGLERKTISDFINSVWSGRFHGHQLPGMVARYTYSWLILEGVWRPSPQGGVVEVYRQGQWGALALGGKPILYRELEGLLISLEVNCGIRVRQTSGKTGTCVFLAALYRWWQKSFEQHKSHLRFVEVAPDVAMLTKPNLVRRWAKDVRAAGGRSQRRWPSSFRPRWHWRWRPNRTGCRWTGSGRRWPSAW